LWLPAGGRIAGPRLSGIRLLASQIRCGGGRVLGRRNFVRVHPDHQVLDVIVDLGELMADASRDE
jgi:hypothetical protein